MIGKFNQQDVSGQEKRATQPLGKVNFDLIISTITSVEGDNAAALFWMTIADSEGCMASSKRTKFWQSPRDGWRKSASCWRNIPCYW
jgi:hypothetical protein